MRGFCHCYFTHSPLRKQVLKCKPLLPCKAASCPCASTHPASRFAKARVNLSSPHRILCCRGELREHTTACTRLQAACASRLASPPPVPALRCVEEGELRQCTQPLPASCAKILRLTAHGCIAFPCRQLQPTSSPPLTRELGAEEKFFAALRLQLA